MAGKLTHTVESIRKALREGRTVMYCRPRRKDLSRDAPKPVHHRVYGVRMRLVTNGGIPWIEVKTKRRHPRFNASVRFVRKSQRFVWRFMVLTDNDLEIRR